MLPPIVVFLKGLFFSASVLQKQIHAGAFVFTNILEQLFFTWPTAAPNTRLPLHGQATASKRLPPNPATGPCAIAPAEREENRSLSEKL